MTDEQLANLYFRAKAQCVGNWVEHVKELLAAGASEGQATFEEWHIEHVSRKPRLDAPKGVFEDDKKAFAAWHARDAEIAALRERIAGMEKDADGPAITADVHADAARYQWLRDRRVEFDLMGLHSYYATKLWQELGERFDWDDTIDAAIHREKSNG